MANDLSRREFLVESALYGGALWAVLSVPRPRALGAAAESAQPVVLTAAQWKTVEAITARIIPTDHEPGAREAGCVNFIDKALAHEDAAAKPLYVAGIAGTDAVSRSHFHRAFAELSAAEQDEVLAALETGKAAGWPKGPVKAGDFFATVLAHTVWGFLADPKYGGNRDYVGWKVVGYPGGQHHRGGYRPSQMAGTDKIVPVWEEQG
jgi:gluconate 2-dehydrogenase gamma chain